MCTLGRSVISFLLGVAVWKGGGGCLFGGGSSRVDLWLYLSTVVPLHFMLCMVDSAVAAASGPGRGKCVMGYVLSSLFTLVCGVCRW